jgi:transposase
MKVTTVGLDLAKSVFQAHGVDERGQRVFSKKLGRDQVVEFFARLTPCLVGMEACGGAHYWAGKLQALGHTVKLMSPRFVKPYVKTNKNDARDAEAICEAVQRPNMRFVPVKTGEQQVVLSLHRARQAMVKMRTAQSNQIRGLLAEFGFVMARGTRTLVKQVPQILAQADDRLPLPMRGLIERLLGQFRQLDEQAAALEHEIEIWHRNNAASRRVAQIPGIGPLTASAYVASTGDPKNFHGGRQVAAWLGLVPRQHSSGGKDVLMGISKRGDPYLRCLLIHGARSVLRSAQKKALAGQQSWASTLASRRNANVAAVAVANKNARIAWALLAHDRHYEPGYALAH